jgi:hypothetical protein
MQSKSKLEIIGTVIAALALIGPASYLCLALFELGRLQYFDAPRDFINFGSFGIYPLLSKVFPVAVPMLLIAGVFGTAYAAQGRVRFIRISVALGMCCSLLSIYSATSAWKWGFGIAMAVCALPGLLLNQHVPEVGNSEDEQPAVPEHPALLSAKRLRQAVYWLPALALFAWVFAAAGTRDAESQKEFWTSEKGVIIGFYGENLLLMSTSGNGVASDFQVIKLEEAGTLTLKPLGPDIRKNSRQTN